MEVKESREGENRQGSNEGNKPLKPEASKEGNHKTESNEKRNEKAEGQKLLSKKPEKKKQSFYSYLVEQGMSKPKAALNAGLFALTVKRRAKLMGKTVSEVMDEYSFEGTGKNNLDSVRGSWAKAKGKRLVDIFKTAKSTTATHEVLGHDYLDTIIEASKQGHTESSTDLDVIAREFKKENKTKLTEKEIRKALEDFDVENIDREKNTDAIKVHEWFAKTAEKYMANPDMKGISPRLKKLFDKFVDYLKDLAGEVLGTPISKPMREIFKKAFGDEFEQAQEAATAYNEEVQDKIDNDSTIDQLFEEAEQLWDEDNSLKDSGSKERATKLILASARKLFEAGATNKNILAKLKERTVGTRNEKGLNDYLDSISDEILKQGEFEFDGKFLPRAGAEKILQNEDVPQEIREYIRKNKGVRGYIPTTIAEMDAMADIIISVMGEDAAAEWATSLDKKSTKFASPKYKARVYKKVVDSLYDKFAKLKAEGETEKAEQVYDKYSKIVKEGLASQTETAQLLASYRGVNGWGEFAVRDAEREIAKENSGKIGKASKTFKQIAEEFKKKDEAINDLMDKNFALEESKEALSDKIAELENESKSRSKEGGSMGNGKRKYENPSAKKQELIDKIRASRAAKGLKDEDTDNVKEYARALMEDAKKLYSFSRFAKQARKELGELTDQELRDAYEGARDEMLSDGFDNNFDSSEVIDKLIADNIVKDEDLKAKLEAKRLEKEAKKDKALADKGAMARIKQAKSDVLEALKEAGYKRGDHVDWAKIATQRQQNAKEAERIIIETINGVKGLTVQDKINLKDELLTKLDKSVKEAQRKLVEKALKENGGSKNLPKGEIDKIVELANTSPNAKEDDIVKAFEKAFDIKTLPKEDAQRIIELGKLLQTETMSKERKQIIDEMTFLATKHAGSRAGRIVMDGLYAGKLSGLVTQLKNSTNRFDIWKQVLGSLARSKGDLNYAKILAKSRHRGIFRDTLESGVSLSKSTVGTDRFGNSTHINELEYLQDKPAWFRKTYGMQKYVGRVMDAIDGENWLRMIEQAEYKFMVRELKSKGYTDSAARKKAFEIMYPISDAEAILQAKKYYANKNKPASKAALKRAAYDIIKQAREKKAESLGIEDLKDVAEGIANWITFKGDAIGGDGDRKQLELAMAGASYIKGGFSNLQDFADKRGKIAQAMASILKFEMQPFVDGIARIMERSSESAVLGTGGFIKGLEQKRFANKTVQNKNIAEMQAEETFTRAMGSLIWQAGMYSLLIAAGKVILAALDEEEDKDKNGFAPSAKIGNKAEENKRSDVFSLGNERINIPYGLMGTDMLTAAIVGNYNPDLSMTAMGLNIMNTVLSQSMFGSESKTLNYLKEVQKASDGDGTLSEATEKALKRNAAQLVTDFIPFRSFIKQNSDMFFNSNDKESMGFVDNIVKYTIGGIGLNDRVDYRGRVIKLGKKYPESAAGIKEMFKQYNYDDWDKLIGGLGRVNFSHRPQNEIIFLGEPISNQDYYEYKRSINEKFNDLLNFRNYIEISKIKPDRENHKTAEQLQRNAVLDLFNKAKKEIDEKYRIKNEHGEYFYKK
ncbi:hypothetical protein [uncultured Flavobacterium sp.]|uniref:hypothetical protein n=1 Tax=uncultured Flavobacterium sp. TaxID=165435 RepID=UPI002593DDE1|nr:hypothetical protein [uncultured Flavobacterium sp.]